nr:hypothetical protein [Tanacetum cinerariifolium]
MGDVDINTLAMEQYLALTRGNQASGVAKPAIGNNVNFEIKSQFMRKLRSFTKMARQSSNKRTSSGGSDELLLSQAN